MKRFVCACLLLSTLYALDAHATNWYVRAGAGGSGTSWTDAWSDVTNIVWASTAPGDTIWIAGGRYGTLTLGKSGNADSVAGRIFIKRATIAAHGGETGWSAGYDTQVVLGQILWSTLNLGSYVTIDGQIPTGILANISMGGGSGVLFKRGATYVTLRYIETAGPCGADLCTHTSDDRGIDTTAGDGAGGFDSMDHFTLQHTKVHGSCTLMWLMKVDNGLLEYNELYDNNSIDNTNCHANVAFSAQSSNVTFRYNIIRNYGIEGIVLKSASLGFADSGAWYIYGNLWYAGGPSAGPFQRVVEVNGANVSQGPVYLYNNTMVGLWHTWNAGNGGIWHPNTTSTNNIYWNSPSVAPFNQSYDFCNGTCPGTGSISGGSDPFVDSSGGNYHLTPTVDATHPNNKGRNLGLPYNITMDGILRGGDGAWDIGAYEYISGGSVAPLPPQGLTVQ